MIYLILILILLVGLLIISAALNAALYIVTAVISGGVAHLFREKREKIFPLSQSGLMSIATIIIFVYSYKGCSYDEPRGGDDNIPLVGGWLLFLTGLITICLVVYCLKDYFVASEKYENNVARAQRSLLREKEAAEREKIFRETSDGLLASPDYSLVKQFAKKFKNQAAWDEVLKLNELLSVRGWGFNDTEVRSLIAIEVDIQALDQARERILVSRPTSKRELLESYLGSFQLRDENGLRALVDILQERRLPFTGEGELVAELKGVHKQLELARFENRLVAGDEQISVDSVDEFNGYKFEQFLKELFSKMGFHVEQTKLTGDQGADLVISKFGERSVIQAKRAGGKVGNHAVQEIMAAISFYSASKGMVITNNYFTPAAKQLAKANNIDLLDRKALQELINAHW